MPPSLPTHCPQCGAAVPAPSFTQREVTCMYCGAPLGQGSAAQVAPASSALPLEFSGLERPTPGSPANPVGCVGIGFGALWFLFSLAVTVFGIYFAYQAQQTYELLQREGQVVTGTITDLEIDDSGDSTDYTVYYSYPIVQEGRQLTLEGQQNIEEELYNTLEIKDPVDVIYAPSQPEVSQLKATFSAPNLLFAILFVGFSLLFDGIGIAILVFSITGLRNYFRLRSSGQETWATVFDRWQDSDSDGDPTYAVAYAFHASLSDGTLKLITRAERNKAVYNTVQIGSRVRVRYIPNDPDINRLV
jgi:hypothetical protein